MQKMCKSKAINDSTAYLFGKQEWDNLISTSYQIAKSKDQTSLGVLNQGVCQYLNMTGQYEMPIVASIDCSPPKDMVALYHIDRHYVDGCIPHFYTEDRRFENTWNFPRKTLNSIANYPMIVSPDFSVYEELAYPQKIWNIFRNKVLAAWWQYNGLKVIPNVSWIYGKDYAVSFDGWPKHSVIAVNSTGINGNVRCKGMWLEGYEVMLKSLTKKIINNMAEHTILHRIIAVKDFWGPGKHIYKDQLGWTLDEKKEVGSLVSKKIFEVEVVEVGLNLAFYYVDNDTFYGIHTECYPIECKILPRDRTEKYIGWQCQADTHAEGQVIASFDDEHDIWNNLRIDGKSLEEVLSRSYIMTLN